MITVDSTHFTRPKFDLLGDRSQQFEADAIQSLPDLIAFNAMKNPHHTFCLQAEPNTEPNESYTVFDPFSLLPVTFRQLAKAADACAATLRKLLPDRCLSSQNEDKQERASSPVALLLESNVGLFIYLATLLAMQVPVVLLSARLNVTSVRHLLKETGVRFLMVSKRTKLMVDGQVEDLVTLEQALPYKTFLEAQERDQALSLFSYPSTIDDLNTKALILHSSGSTGLPKPIHLAQRYLVGYASCHEFSEQKDISRLNLSTLPLYHGFGLLAPCLSLSVGMTCCFPPSSIVPAAHSMLDLLSMIEFQSLMTVPSILEDMLSMSEHKIAKAVALLQPLHFVAVGGGPMKPSTAESLATRGVSVLNHYGATEIGAIAPIFRPGAGYDWRYLRLRKDIGLRLQSVEESQSGQPRKFRLVGKPFGWKQEFEIQDELVMKRSGEHTEIRILGRVDDIIVLKTGEKVDPRLLEETLSKDSRIKSAICIGQDRFELIVLIEPSKSALTDVEELREEVWKSISSINVRMDKHAQISSKSGIIILSDESKPIPRSDKGSFMRREAHTIFDQEIENAYSTLETELTHSISLPSDMVGLQLELHKIVKAVLGATIEGLQMQFNDNLFELGMDSLHATRVARALRASLFQTVGEGKSLSRMSSRFIYQHPSISQLAEGLLLEYLGECRSTVQTFPREQHMQMLLNEYLSTLRTMMKLPSRIGSVESSKNSKAQVLLSGSTGNLGAHVLSSLAAIPDVQRIYCVNRCAVSQSLAEAVSDLMARQKAANDSAGVVIAPEIWGKIKFVAVSKQDPITDLLTTQHEHLVENVTHIVHLAWPMDFQRTLSSFRPQLDQLMYLIGLATAIHTRRPSQTPTLLFASSISTVRNFKFTEGSTQVAERVSRNPLVTTAMGYAEAKWVCEQILQHISEEYSSHLDPQILRIGQLSGPTHDGIWKTEEHIPTLFKMSQQIGAFPRIPGNYSWIPIDIAATGLIEILFSSQPNAGPFYHLENPIRQPLFDLAIHATHALRLSHPPIAFAEWLKRLATMTATATNGDGSSNLLEFFTNDFVALASGEVTLDTRVSRAASAALRSCSGLNAELIRSYVHRWKQMGFLA